MLLLSGSLFKAYKELLPSNWHFKIKNKQKQKGFLSDSWPHFAVYFTQYFAGGCKLGAAAQSCLVLMPYLVKLY